MRGKPDVTLPHDARKQAIASIRRYFKEELDQEVGDLKAGLLLDYVLRELGPTCILNVFNPHYATTEALVAAWSQEVEELDWEQVTETRVVTCHVRKGKVRTQPLVTYPDLVYRVREGAERLEEVVFPLVMRCYFPDEFERLFVKYGFVVSARWGGYADEPYGIGPELVIKATRRPNPATAAGARGTKGRDSSVWQRAWARS